MIRKDYLKLGLEFTHSLTRKDVVFGGFCDMKIGDIWINGIIYQAVDEVSGKKQLYCVEEDEFLKDYERISSN